MGPGSAFGGGGEMGPVPVSVVIAMPHGSTPVVNNLSLFFKTW
jgi:hypothetical protein